MVKMQKYGQFFPELVSCRVHDLNSRILKCSSAKNGQRLLHLATFFFFFWLIIKTVVALKGLRFISIYV